MAGTVSFTMTAETAKAVDGILKIVNAQGKVHEGFDKMKQHGHEAHGVLHKGAEHLSEKLSEIKHEIIGIGVGFLSLETAKEVFEHITESLKKAREELEHFHDKTQAGASLPANEKDPVAYRKMIDQYSMASGMKVDDVADVAKFVDQKMFNAPADERHKLIELAIKSKELGHDPKQFAEAARTISAAYKVSTQQGANMVQFLGEHGLTDEDQASLLPKAMATLNDKGVGLSDAVGLLSTISKIGGSDAQGVKQLQKLVTEIPSLQQKGIVREGSDVVGWMEDLAALKTSDPETYAHEVGRAGPIVSEIAANAADFIITSGQADLVRGDAVSDKIETLEVLDPQMGLMKRHEQYERIKEKQARDITLKQLQNELRIDATEVGFNSVTPLPMHGLVNAKLARLGNFIMPEIADAVQDRMNDGDFPDYGSVRYPGEGAEEHGGEGHAAGGEGHGAHGGGGGHGGGEHGAAPHVAKLGEVAHQEAQTAQINAHSAKTMAEATNRMADIVNKQNAAPARHEPKDTNTNAHTE